MERERELTRDVGRLSVRLVLHCSRPPIQYTARWRCPEGEAVTDGDISKSGSGRDSLSVRPAASPCFFTYAVLAQSFLGVAGGGGGGGGERMILYYTRIKKEGESFKMCIWL